MKAFEKLLRNTDLMLGAGLLVVVAMLIVPLPHFVLDACLVVAIASSVIVLLASVNVSDPLQFSVFPSMLLITTLFRLSLSIAATKLILGTGAAGHVIEAFGTFVMGGDFVVGFVAFLILMIVQFLVITNGAGRVSEVVARFTLDAMPGKQMAIDADLAAGLIDESQARERRKHIKREADFYGAMDGASKFVKGDAIASLLIIAINIVGGIVVGYMRGQGDLMTILKTYALLSVGEGLVSQLPALLISTASGLLVTRAGAEKSMGSEVASQLLAQPKAIQYAGGALILLGFLPGFPLSVFSAIGAGCLFVARLLKTQPTGSAKLNAVRGQQVASTDTAGQGAPSGPSNAEAKAASSSPEAVLGLIAVDPLEIEVGYGLTRLADSRSGGDLPERVSATRKQIALELGFVMPSVRIRDNARLDANEYVLKVRGEDVARSSVQAGAYLAVDSGVVSHPISGAPTTDPVFGLPALWIDPALRQQAERAGYTVIEPTAVISTHLAEIVRAHGAELLTRQDAQNLIENARAVNKAAVEELVPNILQVGDIQKVLQHLLRERVPIRDMVTILETMADFAQRVKDTEQLGELVRAAISRTITRQFVDDENRLSCITLEPALERSLAESIQITAGGAVLAMDPPEQRRLVEELQREMDNATSRGLQAVLLCGTQLRLPLRRMLERQLPSLFVMAYNEVAPKVDVEFVGQVSAA